MELKELVAAARENHRFGDGKFSKSVGPMMAHLQQCADCRTKLRKESPDLPFDYDNYICRIEGRGIKLSQGENLIASKYNKVFLIQDEECFLICLRVPGNLRVTLAYSEAEAEAIFSEKVSEYLRRSNTMEWKAFEGDKGLWR